MVMIEALASGTPVVATPRPAPRPRSSTTASLATSVSARKTLADALQRVGGLDRAACRRAAEARFSLEKMVAGHVALFERVHQRRDPRRSFGTWTRRQQPEGRSARGARAS